MSRIDTHAFGLWWKLAKGWFSTKFASINIDLTPVEEKIDEVKEAVDGVAQQGDNPNATLSETQAQATSAASDAAAAKQAAQAITGYALQGSNSTKTNTQLSSEIADIATLIGYTISEIDNA